jgi:hypothetical protein
MLDVATQKSFQDRINTIRCLKKSDLIGSETQHHLTIQDMGETGFFEYQGQTFYVQDIHPYEETSEDFKTPQGYFIYELTCLCLDTGQTIFFEYEFDDELEMAMTQSRYSFRQLADDQGNAIDEDDLDQIADDKDVIVIDQERFWYEDDWAAVYQKNGKQENVYIYEFENEQHNRFLTIEEWSGSSRDEYRIYTSVPVRPDDIVLISKGKK